MSKQTYHIGVRTIQPRLAGVPIDDQALSMLLAGIANEGWDVLHLFERRGGAITLVVRRKVDVTAPNGTDVIGGADNG